MRIPLTILCFLSAAAISSAADIGSLPGTQPLTMDDDIASEIVAGADRFLLRKIDEATPQRDHHWARDFSSAEGYERSLQPNRARLAHILGVRDPRVSFAAPELLATTDRSALVATGDGFQVYAVRWPVLGHPQPHGENTVSVYAEGLLLEPTGGKSPVACLIAIPDADQTPEQIVGLAEGVDPESQFARRLAENGCRVLVPALINRELKPRRGGAKMTSREFIYRAAYELGRHLIGYEVQKVLAGVDWFVRDAGEQDATIAVVGYGEGGMLALYAGALDTRIDGVCVSGFFGPRETMWNEPLSRNVFGLLEQFGASELATMVAPRTLVVETAIGPIVDLPGGGGAPAVLASPLAAHAEEELDAAALIVARLAESTRRPVPLHAVSPRPAEAFGTKPALERLLHSVLYPEDRFVTARNTIRAIGRPPRSELEWSPESERQLRQLEELDRHTQLLLQESPFVRNKFMKGLDTSSLAAYEASVERYRDFFRNEVIGHFDEPLLPFNARSRKSWETEKWTGHEVVLDVFPDVIAYGVLLLPKDLQPGDERPVVVCQHGLGGRPTDTFLEDHDAYHDYAAKLCERGFITFAPQNLYIFEDRFRTLQRKANPIGKTLFSIIVPQHQQIVNWLQTLPYVDDERIAFYGLSYGGKSAMRIPPLVTDYCLSICSADFNEWVLKNASTRHNFSYMRHREYEIFEFDLGSNFNYAEMAALICPRPFMVERGHFDGVGEDEWVAYEFAKIRYLYAAKLGIGERAEIEWFVGPHTINGQGTFAFLHKHLDWPVAGE
jgi:dienelactone hydrolase